jgi:hypothetical protein
VFLYLAWIFLHLARGSIIKTMKHEYHEGPKAGENFERFARAILQAPKVAVRNKQPKVVG